MNGELLPEHLTYAYMVAHTHDRAVLVVDLCGMTRTCAEPGGLKLFLGWVLELRTVAAAIVRDYALAEIPVPLDLRVHADNVVVVGGLVGDVLDIATVLGERVKAPLAMGIDYGPLLLIPGDAFGDAMNRACKLGEDTAKAGEMLVSERAEKRLAWERQHGRA